MDNNNRIEEIIDILIKNLEELTNNINNNITIDKEYIINNINQIKPTYKELEHEFLQINRHEEETN